MVQRGTVNIDGSEAREQSSQRKRAGEEPSTGSDPCESARSASSAFHSSGRGAYDPPPRRPKSEREHAFDVGAWLAQGLLGINEELRHNDLGLPEEFWTHAYAARKETLLALRALVDAALEKCERQEADRQQKTRPQRGRVQIDFG